MRDNDILKGFSFPVKCFCLCLSQPVAKPSLTARSYTHLLLNSNKAGQSIELKSDRSEINVPLVWIHLLHISLYEALEPNVTGTFLPARLEANAFFERHCV